MPRRDLFDRTLALLLGIIALALVISFMHPSAIRVVIGALIGAFVMHVIDRRG